MDFDSFRMILTFISVANTYIVKYPHHPNKPGDLWECGVLWGRVGKTKYSDLR